MPRFLDETAARSAAALVTDGEVKMGLNGPIPEGFPGHRIAPHIETRQFPLRYLTPPVRRFVRLWRLHSKGFRLRDDAVLHWPAVMVKAIDVLDRETARRRDHVEQT